jgi:hypothetical protein
MIKTMKQLATSRTIPGFRAVLALRVFLAGEATLAVSAEQRGAR